MANDHEANRGYDAPELEAEAVAFFEALQDIAAAGRSEAHVNYGPTEMTLGLPPLGEGDRSLVYPLVRAAAIVSAAEGPLCIKVAKQAPICRQRLIEETRTTEFFISKGIRVPRIFHADDLGRFSVKEYIQGESVTSLYLRFSELSIRAQSQILEGLQHFIDELLRLFRDHPDYKVSISPNNIYVLSEGGKFGSPVQFVLIDPGPTPKKNYDGFSFSKYWNEVLPDRIRKYQRTGYLQWLVPRQVTQSERDEAKEFEIFQGLKPAEIFLLLKIARTVEFDIEEIILQEGTIGENFYLILDGEVELRKGHFTKPGALNLRVRSGSVLGEMGFLLRVPRSMTVVAATPCKLIEIDHDRFHELLDGNLTAPFKLVKNIAAILAERLYSLDNAYQRLLESYPEQEVRDV
jgi:CRP-like cAMP-binding protein